MENLYFILTILLILFIIWLAYKIYKYFYTCKYKFNVEPYNSDEYSKFNQFIKDFNKTYKDKEEFNFRYENFKKTLVRIDEYNKKYGKKILGITQFADNPPRKININKNIRPFDTVDDRGIYITDADLQSVILTRDEQEIYSLDTLNYATTGLVMQSATNKYANNNLTGKVYTQGKCGTCWAFCLTSSLNSFVNIRVLS